ncbi:hypothetical protein VMCG_02053 [Cytospora schulzeri]|uniref:Heterokaryon incompatibility domain-containing protein n=1 Tax=Cytospora schulzeri TaxID=448051 RepID=A0A423X3D2_9PEZI|nr:hypothetical protein VMCG_02053 [Valsa malicola]
MRLINAATLRFEEFFGASIPIYAILSHTWENEEVTFEEFLKPHSTTKDGYIKIKSTCDVALRRGLEYVWIDTCCINKSSSAELTEAINSMFRWYERCELCIAYLVDVAPTGDDPEGFGSSRWFTRGWTLQELLAPHEVDFFSSDWTPIGTRGKLAGPISRITGVDEVYLVTTKRGSRFSLLKQASVAERMSWAARRITTREEDIAYCLLGIFGVNMPLIYGEGMNAFIRLQEEILKNCFDPTLLSWNASS